MKDIIEGLELIKGRLAVMDKFEEAKILKNLIERLENLTKHEFNFRGNTGQVNIASDNSSINTHQEVNVKNKFSWND